MHLINNRPCNCDQINMCGPISDKMKISVGSSNHMDKIQCVGGIWEGGDGGLFKKDVCSHMMPWGCKLLLFLNLTTSTYPVWGSSELAHCEIKPHLGLRPKSLI